ncbi:pyridoxal phosphate-dependent decarboxylase family protein [Oryzifoliimicrobium ureilyticus]|uniref:pyridoxal phosphate-dependent decarboxylase family protein n=1 Tax=Oryzifoliimicrobium ureilyticus TaxID=3113724 RepID=UPI003075F128
MSTNLAISRIAEDAHEGFALQVLSKDNISRRAFRKAVLLAADLVAATSTSTSPYSGADIPALSYFIGELDPMPEIGIGTEAALAEIGPAAIAHSLDVGHPAAMAHLHCPVAIPALAAEVLITATNQSLDSWDQSPFATLVEDHVINWLVGLAGLPSQASGSFTSGGSQSNLTALHLAAEKSGPEARRKGVIFTSEHSHFSIAKGASIIGMPADAVVKVETDEEGRMRVEALAKAIATALDSGRLPVAIAATAGTTDLGTIDPIADIADVADRFGIWMHVDAAYGGGLLFSRHRDKLSGLHRAQSVALDFHKMLFQPISCGALLVADGASFAPLATKADYLNPEDPVFADAPNLVERSIQTTRRSDALKLLITARSLGRNGLDRLISRTLENAKDAAEAISKRRCFALAVTPQLSTVVFRYLSPAGPVRADGLSLKARARLFQNGIAAIATTVLDGRVHFKLTMLNPNSTLEVVAGVLDALETILHDLETHHAF